MKKSLSKKVVAFMVLTNVGFFGSLVNSIPVYASSNDEVTQGLKTNEVKKLTDGVYSVSAKTLKENNEETSMAGTYLEKVNYEVKDDKQYLILSLNRTDWMKGIAIKVDGTEVTSPVKTTEKNDKGEEKGTIKFEVGNLDSKVVMSMNVVPMGNAKVSFRVVLEKDTLKSEAKPEVKPKPKKNTVPVITVGEAIKGEGGKEIDLMAGVSSNDVEDGDLTSKIKVESGKLDFNNPACGTYTVTYSVIDNSGQKVTKTREVVIKAAEEKSGKWINVNTLPKVEETEFGKGWGTYDKYRIEFPGTTNKEFEEFEKYIKAVNDTDKVEVNGTKYNKGSEEEKDNYMFTTIGINIHPSSFTKDINTIIVKADGYNDMKIKIKKDGTFVSQEEIKSENAKNSNAEQPSKVTLPKIEKVEYSKFYSDLMKYRISFLSKTDDDWNCVGKYRKAVNSTNKVTVNGTKYNKGDEKNENNYDFGLVGFELNQSAFKDGINTIVIKADGYQDMTIKIKKDGDKVTLEGSESVDGNADQSEDKANDKESTDKLSNVTTLSKITNTRYGEIYGRVEYEITFEQNDEFDKYVGAADPKNPNTKLAEVSVNGVIYGESYNFSSNQYHLSYLGGLELNDKAFTKDINTIIIKVDGYNDMRIQIKKDGTLVSQEESASASVVKENIKIRIIKDITVTAGQEINLREDVLAEVIGKDKKDLTDEVKVDAGKLDVKNPKEGTYEVSYSVTYNGQTETAKRKVIVTKGNVASDNLADGVYTIGFKAYRTDIPKNESMLGGFFDEKAKVQVKDGKITLTMLNTLYAYSLLDFRIESNGEYVSAKGIYKGEANSQGEYQMQTYEVPISDLTSGHVGRVLVGMMGGRKNDIGNYDKYKEVRLVFDKNCIKGWDGFNKDKEVFNADAEFNKALVKAGLDKDKDGIVTDKEIAQATGIVKLSGEKIKDISRLSNLGSGVTELQLSANDISYLPKDVFNGLTALKVLSLSTNGIVELPEGIFDKLTNLTELSLGKNYISKLPQGIFDKLKNLKFLGLAENQLNELPNGIFDKVTALEGLYLYDNKIENIPTEIGKLKQLQTLSMNNNKIERVPEELSELSKLTSLNLNNNFIKEIPNKVYEGLKNISTFEIYDNELTSIPDNIKELLPNVRQFNFKFNKVKKSPNIGENSFYPQKDNLNLRLTAKDGKLTWKQDLSALDLYVWKTYMDNCSSVDEYNKKLNGKTPKEYLSKKSKDWRIITEIQKKDSSGKYVTIEEISKENEKDVIEGTNNYNDMKAGNEYRIIKSVISTGGLEQRIFSDMATATAEKNEKEKPNKNTIKNGLYDITVKTLKENSDENSMAGTYLEKVNYEVKDDKQYLVLSLNRADWMKNISVKVDGVEVTPTVEITEKNDKGEEKGTIRVEVGSLDSKVVMSMNVVPMGNARVAFRIVFNKNSLVETTAPKSEYKETKPEDKKVDKEKETNPEDKKVDKEKETNPEDKKVDKEKETNPEDKKDKNKIGNKTEDLDKKVNKEKEEKLVKLNSEVVTLENNQNQKKEKSLPKTGSPFDTGVLGGIGAIISALGLGLRKYKNKK